MVSFRTPRPQLLVPVLAVALLALGYQAWGNHGTLPNRIPEPPPYNTTEAQFYPPPWDAEWEGVNNPGSCSNCHSRIFDEWNGSMMSNSWRDPGWRGAFLLISRLTATDGNCDIPAPPDGTAQAQINPFANGDCTSTFNIGVTTHTTSGSGSLLDDFCSRCHMPTNYVDNVNNVIIDTPSGLEHGEVDPNYDPTSDNGTGLAYATLASQFRNTDSGKRGIFCEVCHTYVETRYTPFNNYEKSGVEYVPAAGTNSRDLLVAQADQDLLNPPDPTMLNLGYGIGAGAYRLSPHAIGFPERFGPLTFNDYTATLDPYVSDVFNIQFFYQQGDFSGKHDGFYSALFDRSEHCAACHDVTNPLTIKNDQGKWVGGFPIERTYTEWANSRYADRPTNGNFDPNFKRDCQTCHMQQHFGLPGTAQVLYASLGQPVAPLSGFACKSGPLRPVFYSHHFIGGNAYVPRLIGADIDSGGNVEPYPELSAASYSSADETSIYHNAVWENVSSTGTPTHHARLAWDRLRNVLELNLSGPTSAAAGTTQPLTLSVANTGSGHNFPSGFPEGRNAWVSVRAWDLATGDELMIEDSFWNRTSLGVGYLTTAVAVDPNFPGCNWTTPAGSPDPYAFQFRAVASKGDGCPTLDLPYATPLNLVTNAQGLPTDSTGTVIDRNNPLGKPRFQDVDADGDLYDDSYLLDSRLRPMPHPGATLDLNRYSVVIPAGTVGPVAVTAAVYYQSFEAVVGSKFLGNLADTDQDFALEPCTLKGLCDGRTPVHEPAVVEGAPPVPMELVNWVINIAGTADTTPPAAVSMYPINGGTDAFRDTVVKIQFSEPVSGVDASSFTLVDSGGLSVPAFVDQVGDGVWALVPHQIHLAGRETYTARVAAPVCDLNNNCTSQDIVWSFTVTSAGPGSGDTSIALGFGANGGGGGGDTTPPTVLSVAPPDGAVGVARNVDIVVTFSEAVTGVDGTSFLLNVDGGNGDCSTLGAPFPGIISSNPGGDVWTFNPSGNLDRMVTYCVTVTTAVQDLAGNALAQPFTSRFTTG